MARSLLAQGLAMNGRDIAALNRGSWNRPAAATELVPQGFVDPGERSAFGAVASRVRGQPALDVGVGAGRTVALVALLTDDYVAIDYAPAMVEACRGNHPAVDVRPGDVRDLAEFEDGRFGLVLFSFNGIDNLPHEERPGALRELLRVARPGGWVMLSTHNKDGPSHRAVPWRDYRHAGPGWLRAVRWIAQLPLQLPRYVRRWRNWRRHRGLGREGAGWSEHPSAPHDFGLVQHYVTLDTLFGELRAAGFASIEIYASEDGRRLQPGDETRDANAFHVIAQRP